jgi:C4-dicarboxylate-specific signal transduction histidine kinase
LNPSAQHVKCQRRRQRLRAHSDQPFKRHSLHRAVFNGMDAMAEVPARERRLGIATSKFESGKVMLSVRDRGHGIAPGQLDRIFDSFFTTKKNGMAPRRACNVFR